LACAGYFRQQAPFRALLSHQTQLKEVGAIMKIKDLRRLVIALTAIAIVMCAWYPPIQNVASAQVDAGLKRALVSFASARTLNAIISVVQGTEFSMQPMGVGVTLTLGQVLDPLNDLIEQFSNLMLIASVAFGIQKALLLIGAHGAISATVSGVAVLWAVLHVQHKAPAWLSRVLLVLLLIRFAVPVASVGSDWVYQQFLSEEYQQQQDALDMTSREINKQTPTMVTPAPQDKNWWDRLKDRATEMLPGANTDYEAIKKSAETIPERVTKLIVIFLLQTMIIPIFLLWALYKVVLGVVRPVGAV
jgi:hypothetical protein